MAKRGERKMTGGEPRAKCLEPKWLEPKWLRIYGTTYHPTTHGSIFFLFLLMQRGPACNGMHARRHHTDVPRLCHMVASYLTTTHTTAADARLCNRFKTTSTQAAFAQRHGERPARIGAQEATTRAKQSQAARGLGRTCSRLRRLRIAQIDFSVSWPLLLGVATGQALQTKVGVYRRRYCHMNMNICELSPVLFALGKKQLKP